MRGLLAALLLLGVPAVAAGMLSVTSAAVHEGQPMARDNTGDGRDVSPPLAWQAGPPSTRSYAIVCTDPDAPGGTFYHWVVYDVPPQVTSLPGGIARQAAPALLRGGRQVPNDFGTMGYGGPKPPPGAVHHYQFTVYALDARLPTTLQTRDQVVDAMAGHTLALGRLTGTWQR